MVHVSTVRLPGWRRFTDLTITDLPKDARLIVLAGPNGLGKSSIFDGFRSWQGRFLGYHWDPIYYQKAGTTATTGPDAVSVLFHEDSPLDANFARSAFTFRTAYRMEADFETQGVSNLPPVDQNPRINRMSDTDAAVSANFQRLVANALAQVFNGSRETTIGEIQDGLLASTAEAMRNIFGDVKVENLSDPLQGGAFYFSKGSARNWHYKNLSGGERAAFDLVLDMAVKAPAFPSAIYCIDEPETHLNTKVQGALLKELMNLLPVDSQLWVATHSIGMMREARNRMQEKGDVAFLDLGKYDMDQPAVVRPVKPDRKFWTEALRVALDDMADLVAPATVVLVEGRPKWVGPERGNAEFDARCLRTIFQSNYADTEFLSVGSAHDVQDDTLHLGATTSILSPGTRVIRLIDQDDRSSEQVADLRREGIRVLSQRDLENYLLSDEVLRIFCTQNAAEEDEGTLITEVLDRKRELLKRASTDRGRPEDDVKAIAGELYNWMKVRLRLRQAGNDINEFLRVSMAPCVTPETHTYQSLQEAIFGD